MLVAGLLLIGTVAASDGLFEAAGSRLARIPGGGLTLFASLMALVAAVTVVLNLDTSVVFLTPIVLHAARRRAIDEVAFLYGVVFMSNSASLLLPGSNLTNLLVVSHLHVSGSTFAAHMLPAWVAAVLVTLAVVIVWRRDELRVAGSGEYEVEPYRFGLGTVGVAAAAGLVLALSNAAIPVLAVGVVLALAQITVSHRMTLREARDASSALTLAGLFCFAVALGTLARLWGGPARLMARAGVWATAGIGAGASAAINNLPAAVLLSSRLPAHPAELLVGLDLGPNLVVIGALSAILWLRVARREEAAPSAMTYSKVGVVLVPASMVAALVALQLFGGGAL